MKLPVYSQKGKKLKEMTVKKEVFAINPSEAAVHQAVRAYLAGARRGTASAKTRAEVAGGGRKPWRQKGTGRARAGSIRSPLWVGGGKAFGPKPRNFDMKVPRKVSKLALRSALSAKVKEDALFIVDNLKMKEPKTKQGIEILAALKAERKCTIVVGDKEDNAVKSFRNIPAARVLTYRQINIYDLLDNEVLVCSRPALEKIQEALAK